MTRITANGIEINHRIEGSEGRPWVTFSNSLATDLDLWDEQVALLEDDFRILRYDQRGHGGTDAVAGAKFVLLDPAGHISNVENPDGFNRALGDFVNSL